jgi:hypothetical protein
MLTNLLPGLRDLRAPLSAGYLWLAAGWLYFAPQLPASVENAQGVLKDIYRVVDASEFIAVLTGLSFVAYILGNAFYWFIESSCRLCCKGSTLHSGTSFQAALGN